MENGKLANVSDQKPIKSNAEINLEDGSYDNARNNDDVPDIGLHELDIFLPTANVVRIMRKILPYRVKITDGAKETVQQSVSEFINFITTEANERCQCEHRKTISSEDLLWSMENLGFDSYARPLSHFLQRYREYEGKNKNQPTTSSYPPFYVHHPEGMSPQALDGDFNFGSNMNPNHKGHILPPSE